MRFFYLLAMVCLWSTAAAATSVPSVSVKSVTNEFGVDTHLGIDDYTLPGTITELQYTPFTHVRDQPLYVSIFQIYQQLYAQTGVKLTATISPSYGDSYASQLAYLQSNLSMLKAVTGPNEPNTYPITWNSLSGTAAISAFQYQLAHDFSSLCEPVVTPSDTSFADAIALATMPANYYDIHSYLQTSYIHYSPAVTPIPEISHWEANISIMASGKPPFITEAGGWTVPYPTGYTQNVQAKYDVNTLFDGYILGAKEIDIYELQDEECDPSGSNLQDHLGIFNCDGTNKVASTMVHNLFTILNDSSASFTTTPLNYSLPSYNSLIPNGQQLLMQKTDGTWWLALWNDAQIWDFNLNQEITVNPISVTLNLGSSVTSIITYDPFIGTAAQATCSNTNTCSISVPDHVILVNVRS